MEKREKIIEEISNYFSNKDYIFACWLGWSYANDEVDKYSDIDIFLWVENWKSEFVFDEIEKILFNIWELDFISDIKIEWNQKIRFYHIKNTIDSLIIDLWIIEESDWIIFEESHPYFKPKIIFDKNDFIKFKKINEKELLENIEIFLKEQIDLFWQRSRIKSYIYRKNYIEATNYYIKFMYMPLISLLRIKYTPKLYNWWRIHISRHFSIDIVKELEQLMKFNSIEDIAKNLKISEKWFLEILNELDNE